MRVVWAVNSSADGKPRFASLSLFFPAALPLRSLWQTRPTRALQSKACPPAWHVPSTVPWVEAFGFFLGGAFWLWLLAVFPSPGKLLAAAWCHSLQGPSIHPHLTAHAPTYHKTPPPHANDCDIKKLPPSFPERSSPVCGAQAAFPRFLLPISSMAQASTSDLSRERAVSSEPCQTRPNPFDDSDLSSRKRRRTSLASDSRSRSAETLDSSPSSPPERTPPPPELACDSAMKIDTEPTIPSTPEPRHPDIEPTSEVRSSRVTINVRTPSHSLDAIPSSAPSPSPAGVATPPPAATLPADAVEASIEEDQDVAAVNGAAANVPPSSRSDSGSPPIEVISEGAEDGIDFEDDEAITMLDESGRSLGYDPTVSFPFHDSTESFLETVIRLLQYLPTRKHNRPLSPNPNIATHDPVSDDQVPRAFIEWIDKYLSYVKTASPRAIDESYFLHRDMWQSVPQLVLHMVNRK